MNLDTIIVDMKKQYKVLNIKCGGCAGTVIDALKDKFPDISVDLTAEPCIVSATIDSKEDEEYLLDTLRRYGYPSQTEDLSIMSKKYLSGKSYLSCLHGKLASKTDS